MKDFESLYYNSDDNAVGIMQNINVEDLFYKRHWEIVQKGVKFHAESSTFQLLVDVKLFTENKQAHKS